MASNSTSPGFDSLRYPSWCLSRMIDSIIGKEQTVSHRRKYLGMIGYILNVQRDKKNLYSGSRGEGFSFASSDIDVMSADTQILVMDAIRNSEVNDCHKAVLMMRRDGCNPGFVILQLRNKTNDQTITNSLVDYQGCPVVSSILYRDGYRIAKWGQVGHGPCNTYNYVWDVDMAFCFECKNWPPEAGEFLHRPRPYGWPQEPLLDKIICRGCHLVPIGDKDNDLSYIQWRLSFSAAETALVHSFTHTQSRVYAALKIFLKQVINQIKSVEDLLCSYFLKTVLFYSIESTPASFWREDLLIPCFWYCVNKLSRHIEDGHLPNYFVPKNNMFRNKVSGENQRHLILVFNQLKRIGWSCVYLCEDFRSLKSFVRFPELFLRSEYFLSSQECNFDTLFVTTSDVRMYTDTVRCSIAHLLTLVRYARSQTEKDMSALILYRNLGSIAKYYFCNSCGVKNKERYILLKECERYLLASVKMNFSSGYLSLATFHYQNGQYNKAIQGCQCLLARWKPFLLYKSKILTTVFNEDLYKQYIFGRKLNCLERARTLWVVDEEINPAYKKFYPSDLHYDIEATTPYTLCIPPLPYAAFLLFLCHYKLRNNDASLAALGHLKTLVHDKQQGYKHHPIVLNLLAICLGKVGDTAAAVDACLRSQRIKPERNGADKLLKKLLQ